MNLFSSDFEAQKYVVDTKVQFGTPTNKSDDLLTEGNKQKQDKINKNVSKLVQPRVLRLTINLMFTSTEIDVNKARLFQLQFKAEEQS